MASTLPEFRTVQSESGVGVTYDCGCPCTPTAVPGESEAGFEHCCCGKVHFAGPDAEEQLSRYLAGRVGRKREPTYRRGTTSVPSNGTDIPVAWAFPSD